MRLIDADALWEQMKELHQKRCEESDMTGDRAVCVTWHDAVVCIKDAPTVDAVPVVRCEKCSDWRRTYRHREPTKLGYCGRKNCWMFEKEFCSLGAPREEEHNASD